MIFDLLGRTFLFLCLLFVLVIIRILIETLVLKIKWGIPKWKIATHDLIEIVSFLILVAIGSKLFPQFPIFLQIKSPF